MSRNLFSQLFMANKFHDEIFSQTAVYIFDNSAVT